MLAEVFKSSVNGEQFGKKRTILNETHFSKALKPITQKLAHYIMRARFHFLQL
jgi:hypothetical protein